MNEHAGTLSGTERCGKQALQDGSESLTFVQLCISLHLAVMDSTAQGMAGSARSTRLTICNLKSCLLTLLVLLPEHQALHALQRSPLRR
jgi:hypothetical protein